MPVRSSKVNLVPPSEFESSFWGRFLKWAVTTGRYMIILTEMVVIVAFLMRFKLDEDLRGLNEQINGQVALIESQQKQEIEFKELQNKILLADQMLALRVHPAGLFEYMDLRVPEGAIIKRRAVISGSVSVTAVTLDQNSMGKLMSAVSEDPRWSMVDVTELSGDKANGIKFTITAKE